eukprot:6423691-Pyramimonas_sp.AAC.1
MPALARSSVPARSPLRPLREECAEAGLVRGGNCGRLSPVGTPSAECEDNCGRPDPLEEQQRTDHSRPHKCDPSPLRLGYRLGLLWLSFQDVWDIVL